MATIGVVSSALSDQEHQVQLRRALYPDRIVNKTNGSTFRRWLMQANPALMAVLREVCGDAVLDDPALIQRLAGV